MISLLKFKDKYVYVELKPEAWNMVFLACMFRVTFSYVGAHNHTQVKLAAEAMDLIFTAILTIMEPTECIFSL